MDEVEQAQTVKDGSVAVQSGRDTIINAGISVNDMRAIVETLAQQMPTFAALAREVVNDRLKDFEETLLKRFTEDREKANPEAFKDPDFQYLLNRAQHAFARSGEDVTRDTLVDLIAKRSLEQTRTRLALTLNEAVDKSALLTKNEFAELSLCFLFRNTVRMGEREPNKLARYLRASTMPLLPDIEKEDASYQYLVAQSCASLGLSGVNFSDIFRKVYAGLFMKPVDASEVVIPGVTEERSAFIADALFVSRKDDPSKKSVVVSTSNEIKMLAPVVGLSGDEVKAVWKYVQGKASGGETIMGLLESEFPEIRQLEAIWNDTSLKRMQLTTVGIAIGYANLVRVATFNADLNVWIR